MNLRITRLHLALLVALASSGCEVDPDAPDLASSTEESTDGGSGDAAPPSMGRLKWDAEIQPLLAASCGSCHLGRRFAFASLVRDGADFTPAESKANYEAFLSLLALDRPEHSRLLAKIVPASETESVPHGGGSLAQKGDALYTSLRSWIDVERADRCPGCGMTAAVQYVAYVEQPSLFWALPPDPVRTDHGLRDRSRIFLQPIDPTTFQPKGERIDFLGDQLCGADGRCDFGHLSASYAGDRLVFECRLSLEGADWVEDVRWNVCIAEIGPDGRAVNPRFLMPPERRQHGHTVARSDPFAQYDAGGKEPLKGVYDQHFWVRRRSDATPVFSPDDSRVYLSSRSPDPRTGIDSNQTYHGSTHTSHIIAVRPDGSDPRSIYRNEGGEADFPFFLRNGNVAFHTWNLERMDRHMYTQATADGMMELPVLLGNTQGPNMWGKATQIANGMVIGATGRRRSAIDNYVLFAADHTLGTGVDPSFEPLRILDATVFGEVLDFDVGYCLAPFTGQNCKIDRYYAEPSYSPDGRAFVAYTPNQTWVLQGEEFFQAYASGATIDQQLASLAPYLPQGLGVALVDHHGVVQPFVTPPSGMMYRYPTWVGPRARPAVQPWKTDETATTSELHIADFPLWLSFRSNEADKSVAMAGLDTIVAVRVLEKVTEDNACLNDARPYRYAVNAGAYDHPTHLGINNATGYRRFAVPAALGGDAFGDIPLEADRSVSLRLPAGRLLLLQGVDRAGHVYRQHARLFTMPPGQHVDTSVRRTQYAQQCSACHGSITSGEPLVALSGIGSLGPGVMDFDTLAAAKAPVDVSAAAIRPATYLHAIRPLLDAKCVSCHSGDTPAGELSLEKTYSSTANYPKGKWATTPGLADPSYLAFVPVANRVPGYAYSPSYAWTFREDEAPYQQAFADAIASHQPLGPLAPWDPGYQNLWANDGSRFIYLSGFYNANFGRSDRIGGNSSDSWLIEILTGKDLDPTRSFTGPDHTGYLSDVEVREIMAVIDTGFAYATRCDDRTPTVGPWASGPWGDPSVH